MYKCEYCGKEFEKSQSLAGHKYHCRKNPNFDEEKYHQKNKEKNIKSGNTTKQKNLLKEENIKKERKLICKKCGKEYILSLTDKEFNKGNYPKFCSRSCANSRGPRSEETKRKISESIKKSEIFYKNNQLAIIRREQKRNNKDIKYNEISETKFVIEYEYYCKKCGKKFTNLDYRDVKGKLYCSKECKHKWLSEHTGGYRVGSGHGKSGWYKGIRCDSTWELAFLIYHLDNNLFIERCKEFRTYIYKGEQRIYYPDFITDKGIIEIKGYKTEQSEEKRKQNPDIINIFQEDIQFYLNYIKEKYDKPLIELYDNSKPNNNFLNNKKYIWMHNDNLKKNTMIYPIKYNEYNELGWKYGRKKY